MAIETILAGSTDKTSQTLIQRKPSMVVYDRIGQKTCFPLVTDSFSSEHSKLYAATQNILMNVQMLRNTIVTYVYSAQLMLTQIIVIINSPTCFYT